MEDLVFYRSLLREIELLSFGHTQRFCTSKGEDFNQLLKQVMEYFRGVPITKIAADYMHMVEDLRKEMKSFIYDWKYSCKNEKEAYDKVYSKPEVMEYYMNALLISQILWTHHFKMYHYFKHNVTIFKFRNALEIGAGHGLYSSLLNCDIDIVDVSETALSKTRRMLGDRADYYLEIPDKKYDLILLGEVLEHLDNPLSMIDKAISHLSDKGTIWITVPTNAPAIDHVYLFKTPEEVYDLINEAGLRVITHTVIPADSMTKLIGLFCIR